MSQKGRISLAIDAELLVSLKRLAELENKAVTTVVLDFLHTLHPVVKIKIDALEELSAGKLQDQVLQKYLFESLIAVNNEMNKP